MRNEREEVIDFDEEEIEQTEEETPRVPKRELTEEERERKKERRRRKKEREAARAEKERARLSKENSEMEMSSFPQTASTDQLNPASPDVKTPGDPSPPETSFDDDEANGMAVLDGKKEMLEDAERYTFAKIKERILDAWGTILFAIIWIVFLSCGAALLWPDLDWTAWVTLIDIFICITLLIKDLFPAHLVLLCSMVFLLACQIITVKEALAGFSNEALMTIVVLFVVAKALEVTKAVDLITIHLFRNPKKIWDAQLRLSIPNAILSAFTNNTPMVAMMIPAVEDWAFRTGVPVSKLMLPLSFATVMGGVLSNIGTSTNLVVIEVAEAKVPDVNIGFFEVALVGLPVCVIGIIYIVVGSIWLLPARSTVTEQYLKNPREYTLSVKVTKTSLAANKSIATAGLRNLQGAYLFRIERGEETFTAPDPETILQQDDILTFAGISESMKEVLFYDGLVPATTQVEKITGKAKHRYLLEVVIAPRSALIGQSVLKSRFRMRYNAAIIGVSRSGERVLDNIADIVFQPGDTLLVESGRSFLKYHKHDVNFSLVNQLTNDNGRKQVPKWKTAFTILVTTGLVVFSTVEFIPICSAAFIADCLFLIFRCVTPEEAAESINGELIVLIATAFGLGTALEKTGAAEAISGTMLGFLASSHRILLLGGIYVLTVLLTAVFSNAGTIILLFPICYHFVETGDITIRALIFTLMVAGSCSFLTPIGYQTDMMVMGPGGYTFKDYMRYGIPLTIIIAIVAITVTHLIWNNV